MSNNNVLRYANYCSPEPDEKILDTLLPIDYIDSLYFKHDMFYIQCLEVLSKDINDMVFVKL